MQGIPLGRVSGKKPDVSLRHRMGSTIGTPPPQKSTGPSRVVLLPQQRGGVELLGLTFQAKPQSSRILLSVQCVVWSLGS